MERSRASSSENALCPEPILAAVEGYTGSIFDLDHSLTVGPAEFGQGWRRLAREMREQGLRRGDRLVMAVSNGPLFLAALAAVLAEGGTPLLVHHETPVAELKRTALRIGARFLLTGRREGESLTSAGFRASVLGAGATWTQATWSAVDDSDPAFQAPRYVLPGTPLHPTSGSTGVPKIAVRPGFCAMEEARHYIETLEIDQRDTLLPVSPMSHAYAYGMCAMVPLLANASLATMARFDPGTASRALAELPITVFPATPLALDMLLAATEGKFRSAPRCVLSAGSPLSERTSHAFHKRSGTVVRSLYGTTETGGISIARSNETGPDCVGPPMEGVGVDIRPAEHALPWDKDVGRVHIKSSSMMAGYLGEDGIDAAPLVDGWFTTGDVGRLDRHGAIHLVGRETDVINVNGLKVIPREVEEVLLLLDGVREAKVYAGRRASGAEYVKAALVATGLDLSGIRMYCDQHLVYYKRPEVITLLDSLPKSPSGKVLRDRLP
jgi:acyl-coenzyme A synthetase/AMP-(fatty) acid ligase